MGRLSFKRKKAVLYTKCIRLLQSNICRSIAHFFAHGGLHLFLLIVMGVVSFYLYQYSIYDTNPAYKPIRIKIESPQNIPISGFYMHASVDEKTNIDYIGEKNVLSIQVIYRKFALDSLLPNGKYIDRGLYFNPIYNEITGHYWGQNKVVTKRTNAVSSISFYTPNSTIEDAIGDVKTDISEPRYDISAGLYSFSRIDSITNNYISHSQYFDISRDNNLKEAIKGEHLFSNDKDPIYYRFFIDLDINSSSYSDSISGKITVDFCREDSLGIYTNPKEIISIFPEPDFIRLNEICYQSPSKIKSVLDNRGLYIFVEDINKRKDIEKRTFLCTVLFGAALAFMLDIFVNLIIKWRNLVDR